MSIMLDNSWIDIWPAALGILIVLVFILRHRKHSFSYLVCFFIFGLYVLHAVAVTFFPLPIGEAYAQTMRDVRLMSFVNFIPFHFNWSDFPELVMRGIVQNVVLTIPFGFGLNFVAHIKAKSFLWLAPAVGLGIETAQLAIALMLGYPYRVVDVNDMLLNALGVWIGYVSFRVFAWLYLWLMQRLGIGLGGLTAYIYDVATQHTRPTSSSPMSTS